MWRESWRELELLVSEPTAASWSPHAGRGPLSRAILESSCRRGSCRLLRISRSVSSTGFRGFTGFVRTRHANRTQTPHGRHRGPCGDVFRFSTSRSGRSRSQIRENSRRGRRSSRQSRGVMVQGALHSAPLRQSSSAWSRPAMRLRTLAPHACLIPSLTVRVP